MRDYTDVFGPTYDPIMKKYFVKWKKDSEETYNFKFIKTYSEAEALIKKIKEE